MSTVEEQRQIGKNYRKEETSRKALGMWEPISGREEVVQLIRESEKGRIEELLPLRHEQMAVSPFTFFRGTALLQAHAHAKTGNRHMIAGYLGQGGSFDRAMANYARSYADQNEADYELFINSLRCEKGNT